MGAFETLKCPPYSELYLADIIELQGGAFHYVREILPGVDEKWFVRAFMRSHARKMLDLGNFAYANMTNEEIVVRFVEGELGGEYRRGEQWGGFLPRWAGEAYALYQFVYPCWSRDLLEALTLEDMERIFPALHQMGQYASIKRIHDEVLGLEGDARPNSWRVLMEEWGG
jgi:hypothetical protein